MDIVWKALVRPGSTFACTGWASWDEGAWRCCRSGTPHVTLGLCVSVGFPPGDKNACNHQTPLVCSSTKAAAIPTVLKLLLPNSLDEVAATSQAARYHSVALQCAEGLRKRDGNEQLLLMCVFSECIWNFLSLDWREAVLELGKSWSVAPSAGCWPGRVPHAAALQLRSCTRRENKGQKAPGRNANQGTAGAVQAVCCSGGSGGAFTFRNSVVPR